MALTTRACTETFDERKASLLSSSCYLSFQSLRMVLTSLWQSLATGRCNGENGCTVAFVESMSTEGKAPNLKGHYDSEYEDKD